MVRAYHAAAATLNPTRAFVGGGYADLRQVHAWNTDFVRTSPAGLRYERLAGEIEKALSFMRAIGADPEQLHTVELYASHEALLLDYERPSPGSTRGPGRRMRCPGTCSGGAHPSAGACTWSSPPGSGIRSP